MKNNIRYGYLDEYSDQVTVSMKRGQNIAGWPIGIIYIDDVYYPMMPGNIVNGYTFDFPVRLKAVEGLDIPNLFNCGDQVHDTILDACRTLEREGIRAISSACGFFGNYHRQIADEIDIPVALSSLVQLPWIETLLKPSQKIGVLTADETSITPRLYESCGISPQLQERLVVRGLGKEKEFSCILEGRGEFHNGKVKEELLEKTREIMASDDVGAILLECSDMPPYAYAIQAEAGVPVFDFTTLIRWMHSAVTQTPYRGFI